MADEKILIIGIGAGNPEYVTIQAVNALNQVDVFFIMDKGKLKDAVEEIDRLRKLASQENGWIMDSYLMQKTNDVN